MADVHRVVESLLEQEFEAAEVGITLYLSREPYLLDEGCPKPTPQLESLADRHADRFVMQYVRNTGPYRKIFPVLEDIYALPEADFIRSLVVTADDDTLYPPNWLRDLYSAYLRHRCVVGYRGRSLVANEGRVAPYREWSNTVSRNPSLRNVLTGKDGILYSPLHLHPRVRDVSVALRIAPRADDLWLKAHALLLGVPAHAIHDSLAHEFPSVVPDAQLVSLYRAYNRHGGNDEAVEAIDNYLSRHFRSTFASLTDPGAVLGRAALVI